MNKPVPLSRPLRSALYPPPVRVDERGEGFIYVLQVKHMPGCFYIGQAVKPWEVISAKVRSNLLPKPGLGKLAGLVRTRRRGPDERAIFDAFPYQGHGYVRTSWPKLAAKLSRVTGNKVYKADIDLDDCRRAVLLERAWKATTGTAIVRLR